MSYKIEFYNKTVEDSILEWQPGMRAKFLWISNAIEKCGPHEIGMPHIKTLGQGLCEIRVKANEGIGRIIFCSIQKRIIILNAFIKKTQKTPTNEIDMAQKRMKEIKENE